MKKSLIVVSLLMPAIFNCGAIDGDWRGNLAVGNTNLPLVLHFSNSPDGRIKCTFDSPAQGATGIAGRVVYCTYDSVAVNIPAIDASFSGRIVPGVIMGSFRQKGYSFPLEFVPELSLLERRPQTPVPPFPYTTVDTTFTSADGTVLAGILTMPENHGEDVPAVVLVTGSGPQNRDEEIFEHRPFAVIADYLARNGIATFRYDDRGTAKSHGDFKTAEISTFKDDAAAAFRLLKSVAGISRVGILGHSEGGTIALMLAADGMPSFVISMAGAAERGKDIIMSQNRLSLEKLQLSEKQVDDALTLLSMCFDEIIAGNDTSKIDIEKYIGDNSLDVPSMLVPSIKQSMSAATSPYFRQLISLDPSQWLGKVKCPVLALNGSADTQVNSMANLGVIKDGVRQAIVKEYPGLNHLFQHAATGDITEYINIRETISPEVLADIVAFIRQ